MCTQIFLNKKSNLNFRCDVSGMKNSIMTYWTAIFLNLKFGQPLWGDFIYLKSLYIDAKVILRTAIISAITTATITITEIVFINKIMSIISRQTWYNSWVKFRARSFFGIFRFGYVRVHGYFQVRYLKNSCPCCALSVQRK